MERAVTRASNRAHTMEEENILLRKSAKRKWNIAWVLAIMGFLIILIGLAIGVFYQNYYALQNKKHIDCIIKDLSTPPPPGTSPNAKKYIDIRSTLTADCNIRFTQ